MSKKSFSMLNNILTAILVILVLIELYFDRTLINGLGIVVAFLIFARQKDRLKVWDNVKIQKYFKLELFVTLGLIYVFAFQLFNTKVLNVASNNMMITLWLIPAILLIVIPLIIVLILRKKAKKIVKEYKANRAKANKVHKVNKVKDKKSKK